jgi:hypothetical protein
VFSRFHSNHDSDETVAVFRHRRCMRVLDTLAVLGRGRGQPQRLRRACPRVHIATVVCRGTAIKGAGDGGFLVSGFGLATGVGAPPRFRIRAATLGDGAAFVHSSGCPGDPRAVIDFNATIVTPCGASCTHLAITHPLKTDRVLLVGRAL